ncbi:hypothetical protein CGRA01v4_01753 [Colletotrichum graminicola]|nr:hypothetical protein CGRA01v4_01753 [Colletotrichum graminicola]
MLKSWTLTITSFLLGKKRGGKKSE